METQIKHSLNKPNHNQTSRGQAWGIAEDDEGGQGGFGRYAQQQPAGTCIHYRCVS